MPSSHAEGNRVRPANARTSTAPRRQYAPSMYAHLLCGNREIFVLPSVVVPRAASGRPEAVAVDARDEEVTLVDSTCEAGEQSGAIRCGVGGGRRRDQEECGTAKHGPNAGSGGRVTGARPHT